LLTIKGDPSAESDWREKAYAGAIERADGLTVPSKYLLGRLKVMMGSVDARVIPNAVFVDDFFMDDTRPPISNKERAPIKRALMQEGEAVAVVAANMQINPSKINTTENRHQLQTSILSAASPSPRTGQKPAFMTAWSISSAHKIAVRRSRRRRSNTWAGTGSRHRDLLNIALWKETAMPENAPRINEATFPSSRQTPQRISVIALGFSLGLFLAITFVVCVVFDLVLPSFAMNQVWAPLLPGFTWLSWTGFLIGLVESFAYGWYVALVFGHLYNFFTGR